MNKLKIFENKDFGKVRIVTINDEPWFVASDICRILNLSNTTMAITNLDEDERSKFDLGRQGEANIINESGLYTLILRSDKPQAKPFRKWVTSEVLPSIRKHGGYIAGQENLTDEELLSKALLVAQNKILERDEKIKCLQSENSTLKVDNTIMKPKADYFDELVDRNLLTGFRETAKQLKIKEKEFIAFLINNKYIYRDKSGKLKPYASKNKGLFEMKECYNEKTSWTGTQTLITPKGRETFRLLCVGA